MFCHIPRELISRIGDFKFSWELNFAVLGKNREIHEIFFPRKFLPLRWLFKSFKVCQVDPIVARVNKLYSLWCLKTSPSPRKLIFRFFSTQDIFIPKFFASFCLVEKRGYEMRYTCVIYP